MNLIDRWVIYTNNYCNLHCEFCNTGGEYPMGATPFTAEKWDLDLNDLIKFVDMVPPARMRLCGGEPTAMKISKLEAAIRIIHEAGHEPAMITNGFGLFHIDPEVLQMLANVVIDNHTVNARLALECDAYLLSLGVEHKVGTMAWRHFDLLEAERTKRDTEYAGQRCYLWLYRPALYKDVIVPCCAMHLLKAGGTDVVEHLRDAGWHVDNPEFLSLFIEAQIRKMSNRSTSPDPYIDNLCRYECWQPHFRDGPWKPITAKPNDVERRPF